MVGVEVISFFLSVPGRPVFVFFPEVGASFKHDGFKLPEAIMFETGTNLWKKYEHWPPWYGQKKTYYFNTNHTLSTSPPADPKASNEFISDPSKPVPYMEKCETGMTREYMVADQRFVANRNDVLVYQTVPFAENTVYAGAVQ